MITLQRLDEKTKEVLGQENCRLLPVIHAVTGADTTSRVFGHKEIKESILYKTFNSLSKQ